VTFVSQPFMRLDKRHRFLPDRLRGVALLLEVRGILMHELPVHLVPSRNSAARQKFLKLVEGGAVTFLRGLTCAPHHPRPASERLVLLAAFSEWKASCGRNMGPGRQSVFDGHCMI